MNNLFLKIERVRRKLIDFTLVFSMAHKAIKTVLWCGFILAVTVQAGPADLKWLGKIESDPLEEVSGIVKSRNRDNLYWVHNDSGHDARIFALNSEGNNVLPTYSRFSFYGEEKEKSKKQWPGFKVLFTENVDWEDIAIDDKYLYLADIGNNGNDRKDLGVYAVSEIDPTASTQSASIKYIPVRYPEQEHFPAKKRYYDSESLFTSEGKLYFITKHRQNTLTTQWEAGANLYRLDSQHTDKDNDLIMIDHHPDITAATGADVSPNGKILAVISYSEIWLFEKPQKGDKWLSGDFRKFELDSEQAKQLEAVTWENDDTLLLVNEQRDRFHFEIP